MQRSNALPLRRGKARGDDGVDIRVLDCAASAGQDSPRAAILRARRLQGSEATRTFAMIVAYGPAGAEAGRRAFLARLGYEVHDWGLGLNLGPRTAGRRGERLAAHFASLAAAHGQRMSVVGWSLGGIMARQLARRAPQHVRRVITLGAPFTGDPRASSVAGLYQLVAGQRFSHPDFQAMLRQSRRPPPVPATSIFSRADRIAAWECCQEPAAPHTENIEVDGSHGGLLAHPQALLAIAERLALPEPLGDELPDEPATSWWQLLGGWVAAQQVRA